VAHDLRLGRNDDFRKLAVAGESERSAHHASKRVARRDPGGGPLKPCRRNLRRLGIEGVEAARGSLSAAGSFGDVGKAGGQVPVAPGSAPLASSEAGLRPFVVRVPEPVPRTLLASLARLARGALSSCLWPPPRHPHEPTPFVRFRPTRRRPS
jgi:hypothetical protein